MTTQVGWIDPQKRERENDHDRFAKKWLARCGESRNGQPNEDRRRRQQRPMAASQAKRGRNGDADRFHLGRLRPRISANA
jgi:hypothetical protein